MTDETKHTEEDLKQYRKLMGLPETEGTQEPAEIKTRKPKGNK